MYVPRGGVGGAAIAARPGGVAGAEGRFDNRYGNRGDWRYGYGATGGRYPDYGGRYPYYGVGAGLATGAVIGAAATYPYYNYPYSTYQTPVSSSVGEYCVTAVLTCALTNSARSGPDAPVAPQEDEPAAPYSKHGGTEASDPPWRQMR